MARAPVSKTGWFASNFRAHSEKSSLFVSKGINRLAADSEDASLAIAA
jgi:hypothetical protein